MLTENDYKEAADLIGCDVEAIKAVAIVESKQSGFLKDGRPTILYEPFVFARLTRGRHSNVTYKGYPLSLSGRWDRLKAKYVGGAFEYEKLEAAKLLDEKCALESCSWGRFQIMGFNYRLCGFPDVQSFVKSMEVSEKNQLLAFVQFIKSVRLSDELKVKGLSKVDRFKKWYKFQQVYNGGGNQKYQNHLENAYQQVLKTTKQQ